MASSSANVNYYLGAEPESSVDIAILDDEGNLVRELTGSKKIGVNRVSWNLRYEGAREAKLRTKPPGNPRVVEEKRFRDTWNREGWYPIRSWGTGGGFRGVRVAPGTYTIRMTIDDNVFEQTLEVRKDPHSEGSLDDIRAQVALQLQLRDDINTVSDMLSDIEWTKRQVIDHKVVLSDAEAETDVIEAADAVLLALQTLEDRIFQKFAAEGDSKSFRYPNLLYAQLSVLAGDVASSVDFAPNAQQHEVHAALRERMITAQSDFEALMEGDVRAFNERLHEAELGAIVLPLLD